MKIIGHQLVIAHFSCFPFDENVWILPEGSNSYVPNVTGGAGEAVRGGVVTGTVEQIICRNKMQRSVKTTY